MLSIAERGDPPTLVRLEDGSYRKTVSEEDRKIVQAVKGIKDPMEVRRILKEMGVLPEDAGPNVVIDFAEPEAQIDPRAGSSIYRPKQKP